MGMTYITYPTRTLYAVWTTRVTPTEVVIEVQPVRPSTVTNVMTYQRCGGSGWGPCWTETTTRRSTIAASVTTRTKTVAGTPSASTVSSPTATLFSTTRFPASPLPSGMEIVTGPGTSLVTRTVTDPLSSTWSKTLVGDNDLSGGDDAASPGLDRLRIAAIVGGLLGGFLAPILLVFLIRYLLRRRRNRGGSNLSLSPSMRSSASFAPRALSPSATLVRSPTFTEGGHLAVGVDRRVSRASRASRITHDNRYQPNASPSGSSHGHGVSSHGHESGGATPVRRPSVVHYAPVPVPLRAASPSRIRTPSPVLHRNPAINSVPPVPPVPYMPPVAYDSSRIPTHPVTIPPQSFASVPLASVAETNPMIKSLPPDRDVEAADAAVDPMPPPKTDNEWTQHISDGTLTNS
ncbi:hypothetical protein BKA70DRAFT_1435051 [Coprinopsis sp. MPI-PUGE-AT-0042]|nr:hypothetical protein BKA70DRAFT_1435051 [Coprinopsis sp. MPI-PUGE-AT-0042]